MKDFFKSWNWIAISVFLFISSLVSVSLYDAALSDQYDKTNHAYMLYTTACYKITDLQSALTESQQQLKLLEDSINIINNKASTKSEDVTKRLESKEDCIRSPGSK